MTAALAKFPSGAFLPAESKVQIQVTAIRPMQENVCRMRVILLT